jgi:RNA-directed DNA polymerase
MSNDKREKLQARIRETSKDEVILDEMIRRGFWRENAGQPSLPADLIKRQGEVRRELDSLAKDAAAYEDPDRALQRIRFDRMKAARERRVETKKKRAQARYERATAWHQRQGKAVTHLGDTISAALHGAEGKAERRAQLKLPAIADPAGLATAMGIKTGELRFLAYDRKVAKVDHYRRFTIPKKTGGVREISAPMPRLKRAQYWIMKNILEPLPGHDASHGFRTQRSILTNAHPHAGQRVVINIDLKDFFPTITYARVKGFFVSLGYPEKVAAPLALICTDAERDKLQIDGNIWNIARGERRLPQGAPTSPAIANQIANRLDKRMAGAAKAVGFVYTRYADDMTFSGNAAPGSVQVDRLLWQLRQIAEDEGFTFNDKKTRVMGSGTRQDVTGLVVNKQPAVARHERRRFRAWLHAAEAAGLKGAEVPAWTNAKGAHSDALGFASYLAMVNAKHGAPMVARTKAVYGGERTGRGRTGSAKPGSTSRNDFRKAAGDGRAPNAKWWTPAERAAPQMELIATPKSTPQAATQGPSVVPPISAGGGAARTARASHWGARENSEHSQGSGSAGAPTSPAKPAPNFWISVLLSIVALPLVAIPAVGSFFVFALWFWIWRAYFRGRGGRS